MIPTNRRYHISRLAAIFFIAVAMMAVSCRSSRQSVSETRPGAEVALTERYEQLAASYQPQWERLEIPLSAKASGLPFSLSGTASMERGRSIAISLRMLGMEVAAARVTPDSVIVVDKYNNRHLVAPLAAVTSRLNMDVSNIQDMLLGRVFSLGSDRLPAARDAGQSLTLAGDSASSLWYILPQLPEGSPIDYAFEISNADRLLRLIAQVGADRVVSVSYQPSATATPFGFFADRADIVYPASGPSKITGRIQWKFDKARWNGDAREVTVMIPSQSKPVSAASLLKLLSGQQ
ncbi:MAG: DUF4292 domain-containing protein [Clostridium sp.]|nr:DUF4292 domain-containing protein [Clostridium sp.]